ncbi:GAF domain-containing hybrid sensor histidine kinase/response regulator [Salinimicrobium soli]|uniref:GAF domain-containing hybrid sensor histidine kinase/response regulator n=1 Tax=Salinimicrobium soli TaxID=1254399 RepID=UPI003AAB249B
MNNSPEQQEIERLKTLLSYNILDTPPEEDFDNIARMISIICETPVALISMMDHNRQWFKAKVGMEDNEVIREETFCQYTIRQSSLLEIPDATLDERVKNSPFVTQDNGIRFYAGIPLTASNGYNIGTVCVADNKPRKLSESQKEALDLLSKQVMYLIESRKKNRQLSTELEQVLNKKIEAAQRSFKQKEAEYNHLLAAIKLSNSVVEFSPQGEILQANEIFLNVMGYDEKELRGKSHEILIFEEERILNTGFWNDLEKGKFKGGRYRRRHKNGSDIWYQATYNPILNLEQEVVKVIKIAQDITSEIEAAQTLQKAKEAAESLNVQKDNFIANVSHEIRTPIHAILGFTGLLLEEEQEESKLSYLRSVKTAGDNLLFLVNDILDLSKIDAGLIQMDSAPFSPAEVVENVFSILHLKAQEKNIGLDLNFGPEVPGHLMGDRNRLSQILINLVGNAIKFTEKGRVELEVAVKKELHGVYYVEFKVKDSGTGIPKDKLETIFQRFSQADEGISRKYGGTGLGLNISRQLVEKQEGSMEVASEPGKGSVFSFTIPYRKAEIVEKDAPGNAEQLDENCFGRILLCEDNELNQRLVRVLLSEKGYTVDIAENGRKGLEYFAALDYDLVLMDLQMPEKDGFQTTREIRQKFGSKVPVVALTANFMLVERERCFAAGMNDYLSKPFTKNELLQVIQKWVPGRIFSEEVVASSEEKPVFSMAYLEDFSGGDEAFQQEMIGLFLVKSAEMHNHLKTAFEKEDLSEVKATAHKMKASFGIVGADLSLLHNLESLEQFDREEIGDNLNRLERQLNNLYSYIRKEIKVP